MILLMPSLYTELIIKFTFNILLFSAFAFKVFISKKHESYSTTQLTLASTWGWGWSVMVTSQHYLTIISRTWQMCRSFYSVSLMSVVRVMCNRVLQRSSPLDSWLPHSSAGLEMHDGAWWWYAGDVTDAATQLTMFKSPVSRLSHQNSVPAYMW